MSFFKKIGVASASASAICALSFNAQAEDKDQYFVPFAIGDKVCVYPDRTNGDKKWHGRVESYGVEIGKKNSTSYTVTTNDDAITVYYIDPKRLEKGDCSPQLLSSASSNQLRFLA